jgi:hypothetical protein
MANPSEKGALSSGVSSQPLHGLSLPSATLHALQRRGIYCTPGATVEHQHLAKRYVLRGVESGGAVADMGRFCAYLSADGLPLPWLQTIDSLAVNGRHAIILAESLVRVEMLRMVRTWRVVHIPARVVSTAWENTSGDYIEINVSRT